jgi:hypothetical protein
VAGRRARKYKAIVADVNEVLYCEWAPLGFVGLLPKDEYEPYAVRVVSMLASGANVDELASYLATTAASVSGNLVSVASVEPVARRLVAFREAACATAL